MNFDTFLTIGIVAVFGIFVVRLFVKVNDAMTEISNEVLTKHFEQKAKAEEPAKPVAEKKTPAKKKVAIKKTTPVVSTGRKPRAKAKK